MSKKKMDFYYANYQTSVRKGHSKLKDILLLRDVITEGKYVVIANSQEEAVQKINECVKAHTDDKRATVLTSEVKACNGLNFERGNYGSRFYPV